ncbi:hypothetical protein L6164_026826 [Bauhinia variegata]|uniref:Uncharacterized protein n=1 Tax=Bauhinia variegata TaxID=167791 RepID=A0ACB9LSW3_BAUVA|nr:hypothetical protein L6164_026826 [Bauhinia variegata]
MFVGWGPHAYFQMLAESRNATQCLSPNNGSLHVQQTELHSVYIDPQETVQVNSWDSSPMLDGHGSETTIRH